MIISQNDFMILEWQRGYKTGTARILFIVCNLRKSSLGDAGGLLRVGSMVSFGVHSGFPGHLMNSLSGLPI